MKKPVKNLNQKLVIWAVIVAVILMIPLVLQAPWTLGDFITAGIVLFGAAAGYEIVANKLKNKAYRWVAATVAIGVVMSLWALAVAGP